MENKKRYICLDSVVTKLKNDIEFTSREDFPFPRLANTIRCLIQDVINWIEKQPVADVKEVVHAQWIVENGKVVCSNCGERGPVIVEYTGGRYIGGDYEFEPAGQYCHGCGAHMDNFNN